MGERLSFVSVLLLCSADVGSKQSQTQILSGIVANANNMLLSETEAAHFNFVFSGEMSDGMKRVKCTRFARTTSTGT